MKENKDKNVKNTNPSGNNSESKMKTETNDKINAPGDENLNTVEVTDINEVNNTGTTDVMDNNPKGNKKFKWIAAGVCAAILILGLAGGALAYAIISDDDDDHNNGYNNDVHSNSHNSEYIGENEAKAIAFEHAGVKESEISNLFCKLDNDDKVAEYDVEFWVDNMEYDYEINAITSEISSYDNDLENDGTNSNNSSSQNSDYITSEEAKNIALKDAGFNESDTHYLKSEFNKDDGHAEYEIEWKIGNKEYEYTISATDGTILEREIN